MAEENKSAEPNKKTQNPSVASDQKQEGKMATPDSKEENKIQPDFQYTYAFDARENFPAILPAYKTQKRVLRELLPKRKQAYSLPEWHRTNKQDEDDDLLYLLCGFTHPAEQEMLHYYVERWQRKLIEDKMSDKNFSDDDDDEAPRRTISVPFATLENFLKDPKQAEWLLENHENLLLRLSAVRPMVRNLDLALNLEGIRNESNEWESAMDELVGQKEFEDSASRPQDEEACWVWMNKMVAPQRKGLWKMDLSNTREELGELDWFRIYKSFADMWDYIYDPRCTQRVNGKLEKVWLPWVAAKVRATIDYLIDQEFLKQDVFKAVCAMTPQERKEEEQMLKRRAVGAFLTDMSKSSPSSEILTKFMKGFTWYFQPILQKTGPFTFQQISRAYKNRNGHDKINNVVNVAFYNTIKKRNEAVKKSGKPATRISPQTPNQPDGRA